MLVILSTGPLAVIGNSDSRTKDIAPSNHEYNIVSMTSIMNTLSITCMHEIANHKNTSNFFSYKMSMFTDVHYIKIISYFEQFLW